MDVRSVVLDAPADHEGFRRAARALVARGTRPEHVQWSVAGDAAHDLFGDSAMPLFPEGDAAGTHGAVGAAYPETPAGEATLRVPPAFMPLVRTTVCHRAPHRFGLLYRLLWRLQHEPGLRGDPLDPDWMAAEQMAREVRLDAHKMKAYVRFRPLPAAEGEPPWHVAWFEPEHHIVEKVAPFFADRFTAMRWAVLTPLRSVSWDGRQLSFGDGAQRDDAPAADAGEALWLTYYAHIFNPARLKLATMRKEMPRRYWKNLPESVLIAPLAQGAHERSLRMVEEEATTPQRRLPAAPARPAPAADPGRLQAGAPVQERTVHWAATREAASGCQRCPLHANATQTVFGEGPIAARRMVVGEQPGDHEDVHGRPFTGPAGRLFDQVLGQLGVARAELYVTNAVKHFKYELRGTRRIHKTAAQQETAACLDWLDREIDLVNPDALVALGATAARALLGRAVAVTRERGQWIERADGRRVFVTLHPSALLRLPPEAREQAVQAWTADLARALG